MARAFSFRLPFQLPHLGRRAQLAVRYTGIGLLALIVFVFALQLTFPYERVKDKAIEALSGSYDVTIGGVERGFVPGRVYFKAVTLRTRPTKPDEKVTTFFLEKVEVDLGLLALIGLNASINLDMKVGAGRIHGNITLPKFGKNGVKIDLDGSDLPGASLPMASMIGLPVTGKIEFSLALDLPTSKNKMGRQVMDWSKADGEIDLSCPAGCTLGDGHTKLKPLLKNRTNQVMVQDGIDFGKVNLDSLKAHGVFTPAVGDPEAHSSGYKPGKFELKKFEVKSPDGELHVDYSMTLAQEFGESIVAGCLRFKGNESLLKKEETKKTYAAISTTGAELRSDGLFHIRLTDRFKDMKRLNQECGPNAKTNNGEDFSARPGGPGGPGARPTIEPDTVMKTGIGTATTKQAEPPPPPTPIPTAPADAGAAAPPPPPPGEAPGSAGSAANAGGSGEAQISPQPIR